MPAASLLCAQKSPRRSPQPNTKRREGALRHIFVRLGMDGHRRLLGRLERDLRRRPSGSAPLTVPSVEIHTNRFEVGAAFSTLMVLCPGCSVVAWRQHGGVLQRRRRRRLRRADLHLGAGAGDVDGDLADLRGLRQLQHQPDAVLEARERHRVACRCRSARRWPDCRRSPAGPRAGSSASPSGEKTVAATGFTAARRAAAGLRCRTRRVEAEFVACRGRRRRRRKSGSAPTPAPSARPR